MSPQNTSTFMATSPTLSYTLRGDYSAFWNSLMSMLTVTVLLHLISSNTYNITGNIYIIQHNAGHHHSNITGNIYIIQHNAGHHHSTIAGNIYIIQHNAGHHHSTIAHQTTRIIRPFIHNNIHLELWFFLYYKFRNRTTLLDRNCVHNKIEPRSDKLVTFDPINIFTCSPLVIILLNTTVDTPPTTSDTLGTVYTNELSTYNINIPQLTDRRSNVYHNLLVSCSQSF